jgi:hypothetical protein
MKAATTGRVGAEAGAAIGASEGGIAAGEEPRIRWDGIVGEAALPLPSIDASLRNLSRQSALMAPAKLTLSPAGLALLLAEVPASDDRERGAETVRAALRTAALWVSGHGPTDDRGREGRAPDATEASAARWIEDALGTLAWTWERDDGDAYRIVAASASAAARLAPVAQGRGVRVWLEPRPLRTAAPGVELAIRLFALEVNARFRLARLSVGGPGDGGSSGVLTVAWDTVVLPDVGGVRWLALAIEALAVADAETRRALRALTTATVAAAYVGGRDPRRRRDAGTTTGRAAAATGSGQGGGEVVAA